MSSVAVRPTSGFARQAEAADRCPGYGMCRIDFLGIGVCPVGRERHFAAFYPQGRMRVIGAFRRGALPVTDGLLEVARSCTECGVCDKQCYFTAGIRSLRLFQAFKEEVATLAAPAAGQGADPVLAELVACVGRGWVSADPAILASYGWARSPLAEETPPRYVALPGSTAEVASLVRTCRHREIPFAARGAGTSLAGALSDGLVIDLARMNGLSIDRPRWTATVGPGVLAFDLQAAAVKVGMWASVAEPAACVCANVLCTNMHSFLSYAWGVGIDHVVDAELVDPTGRVYRLSDPDAPNLVSLPGARSAAEAGICTEMEIRLHPAPPDEDCVFVPCGSLEEAVAVARDIARRRIGTGLGVMGTAYVSMFAAPSPAAVPRIRRALEDGLGVRAFVVCIGDRSVLAAIPSFAGPVLSRALGGLLLRALPSLDRDPELQWMMEQGGGEARYKELFAPGLRPLVEMALRARACVPDDGVDADLRGFFEAFLRRPETADSVWLNLFRILPARMGRGHQFVSRVLYCSLDEPGAVPRACERLGEIGERHGLPHAFGYLVPLADGTRAVMEYDLYFDATDPRQVREVRAAMKEAAETERELCAGPDFVCSGESVRLHGLSRPATYLFGGRR